MAACSHHQKHRDAVLDYRGQLVGLVADAPVVSDDDPAAAPDVRQPHGVRCVGGEVVRVPLDRKAGPPKPRRKLFAEIAVGKVNAAHELGAPRRL